MIQKGGVMTHTYHPIIPDKDLPDCLKRKLVFGDREQIDALRDLEIFIAKHEEETGKKARGALKQYQVTVHYSGSESFDVWAESEEEAKEAGRETELDPYDFDVDHVSVREVNKEKAAE